MMQGRGHVGGGLVNRGIPIGSLGITYEDFNICYKSRGKGERTRRDIFPRGEEGNRETVYIELSTCGHSDRRGNIRIMMEIRTVKPTMGWSAVARISCCVSAGLRGSGNRWMANVEMKIAPTPI